MPPRRDLYELARSLRHKSQEPIPRLRHPVPPDLQVGQVDTFKVLANVEPVEFHEIDARLEHVSDNAYWYIQLGVRFNRDSLEESAEIGSDLRGGDSSRSSIFLRPTVEPGGSPGPAADHTTRINAGAWGLLQLRRRISHPCAREQQPAEDHLYEPGGFPNRHAKLPRNTGPRASACHQLEP